MKIITIKKIKEVIAASENKIDNPYRQLYNKYMPSDIGPITTKNIAANCINYVLDLDDSHQLAVCVANATGNVNVRIKATDDVINSDRLDYSKHELSQDVKNEYDAFVSVPTSTHEFIIDDDQRLSYINQANSIWLPEIPLKTVLNRNKIINHNPDIAYVIYHLAKTYNITTTDELMDKLNQCYIEVDYVTDILKITTPMANTNTSRVYVEYLIQKYESYFLQYNGENHNLPYDVKESMQKYYTALYDILIKTDAYPVKTLAVVYNNVKMHHQHIQKGWQMIFDERIDEDSINSFNIINDSDINHQVKIKSKHQLYHTFVAALLQSHDNTSVLNVLLDNIETQIQHTFDTTEQVFEIKTLIATPEITTYMVEHKKSIITKLAY